MPRGNETSVSSLLVDEAMKTPSRRANPPMSKILSNDPLTPENKKALTFEDPVVKENTMPTRSIVATTPLRQSGVRAQDDTIVLHERLAQEIKAREALEKRANKEVAERQRAELDLQTKNEQLIQLERLVAQEKEQRSLDAIKAKQVESALQQQLKKESVLRHQAESDLSRINKLHNDVTLGRLREEAEAHSVKVDLQQATKLLTANEKQLTQTQKIRTRRSIDYNEERNLRLHAQAELDQLKVSSKQTIDILNAKINSLEGQVATCREKERAAVAQSELAASEATQQRAIAQAATDNAKVAAQRLEEAEKTIKRITLELNSERAAYRLLEQQCVTDIRKTRKEMEVTLEQLRSHRDETLQAVRASLALEQANSIEHRERRQAEEALSSSMSAQSVLEQALHVERSERRPQLEHTLQTREQENAVLRDLVARSTEKLTHLEQLQQQYTHEIASLNEVIETIRVDNKSLEHRLKVALEQLEQQTQKAKADRLRMDQEYDLKERTIKSTRR